MSPTSTTATRPEAVAERPPRVGLLSFLNCRPVLWGLRRLGLLPGLDLLSLSPEAAGDRLIAGRLDLGPVSLAEYLRHTDDLLLLPELAIAAEGPVMSCHIVTRAPLHEVPADLRVGLTSTSRTTVLLARLLLEERLGLTPRYFTGPPEPAALLRRGDAAVVIGDPALRVHFDGVPQDGRTIVHDTAELWTEWTGLPMVFAVWAVRREYAEREPHAVAAVHRALLAARDCGLAQLPQVAAEAARTSDFTSAQLLSYYETLRYELTRDGEHAIRHFADLAAHRGLLSEDWAIRRFEGAP
ncbi:menaquinone biosynthetic enzyme MqnA/MqnD family protein [Streptomyces sp. NPDC051963]|uniref:menaquinone biosynthetic enzyme MqnA/MqnD family protein n=1 Tax=Streptomyces sp. NPDC051963 TaxID=3365678 RepID=UPI0037CDDECB